MTKLHKFANEFIRGIKILFSSPAKLFIGCKHCNENCIDVEYLGRKKEHEYYASYCMYCDKITYFSVDTLKHSPIGDLE